MYEECQKLACNNCYETKERGRTHESNAKKIATFILSVCLIVPCFGMLTYAADGQIVFSDPSTKVGETVEVTGVVRAGADNR